MRSLPRSCWLCSGWPFWRANASTARATREAPRGDDRTVVHPGVAGQRERDIFAGAAGQPGNSQVRYAGKLAYPGGKLHLKYQIPRNATQEYTYADVRLNDSVLASVTPTAEERDAGAGELSVPLPPELLMARNELTIQLSRSGQWGVCGCRGKETAVVAHRSRK